MNLTDWLNDLRHRRCHLTIAGQVIVIHGTARNDQDRHHADRHRHALHLAAARTHPDWWAYACGRTDHPPEPDQIPVAADDPDAYACATCAAPAAHLDHQLLPWCDRHHRPDLEEAGHAA